MDVKEKRKTIEGRASEFDFIQFIFSRWHKRLTEIWHFSRETSRSIYKSTRERVDSRNQWRWRLHLMIWFPVNPLYLFSDIFFQRRAQTIRRNKKVKKLVKRRQEEFNKKKREIVISICIIIHIYRQALPLEESPTYRQNGLFYL